VGGRRGGLGYLYAGFAVLSLVRWPVLSGFHDRIWMPGEDEISFIHVVCPEEGCTNKWWERAYSPDNVKTCGAHEGDRVPMIPCEGCPAEPGLHLPPEGWQ
jgi:hypothetical protein